MIQTTPTSTDPRAAEKVHALRQKAITVGLTEAEESQMRRYAGAPPKNEEEIKALIARCDALFAEPLRTPNLLMHYRLS